MHNTSSKSKVLWTQIFGQLPLIIGGFCLVAMMLQVTVDVAGKFLFRFPVPVTTEMVTYYYMVGVALLPLYSLERKSSSLVYVEIVYNLLPSLLKKLVHLFSLTVAAAYCFALAYAAWKPALQAFNTGTYAGSIYTVIIWPTRFFPVIGFGLLGFMLITKLILILIGRFNEANNQESILKEEGLPS